MENIELCRSKGRRKLSKLEWAHYKKVPSNLSSRLQSFITVIEKPYLNSYTKTTKTGFKVEIFLKDFLKSNQ